MREKLSQKVLNLKSSGIRAFFDMANEIPDVISLGVGEPDFDTPWHIREAGIQDVAMKLYEGDRHEILNETDRELVYEDIYEWISEKIQVS